MLAVYINIISNMLLAAHMYESGIEKQSKNSIRTPVYKLVEMYLCAVDMMEGVSFPILPFLHSGQVHVIVSLQVEQNFFNYRKSSTGVYFVHNSRENNENLPR